MERISIRDAIFREVASNILIHREYTNAFPARLIIQRGYVRAENSNKPHGYGLLNPATFTPFPKNPVIGAFFREIHRADELGSGMRKMMRYGKVYGGADPEMIEGDIFRTIVKVPEFGVTGEKPVAPEVARDAGSEAQSEAQSAGIVRSLASGPLSARELVDKLGLKSKTGALKRSLHELLNRGLAEYTIPGKPNSRLQKYRLTEKGRKVLNGIEGGRE
jgi:ATP-dependent DNA helicase RecG